MTFELIDWIVLALFFILSIGIGLRYASSAGKSVSEFFLGGRSLPWWIAGTSMVATTFAADTPLLVAGIVSKNGISGNWLWWNMLLGGILTTFFFAKYWRRSGVLTEVELIELRYSGKPAAFLRGFKAVYLGLIMNAVIIGWVNKAMINILEGFFGISPELALFYVAIAMVIVAIYSAISGLMGVAITDVVQFLIAMTGCIVLAIIVVNSDQIGGITGLKAKLPEWSLSFTPAIGEKSSDSISTALTIGVGAFFARIGIQWWASWYPGAEPGGGGYVAQRMMSCKDEKHAVYATLFFQIAHYCLRPWPWILVGLCAIVLYPQLGAGEKEMGYVLAMRDFLPAGMRGLLLAAFFAAYMSTISTQLNWGASYLVNDLYKRFVKPDGTEKQLVSASRIVTILLMAIALVVTTMLNTIEGAWGFIIECGAGLGLVLILRWYWWRINAWSEIAATIAPFFAYAFSVWILKLSFPESFFITVGFTTVAWLAVTFLTKPETDATLKKFYDKVRPAGVWQPVAERQGDKVDNSNMPGLFICWVSAVALIYATLFGIGKAIFLEWANAGICAAIAVLSLLILSQAMKRYKILE
jgi:SSS family solute:Na+ symporter